MTATRYASIALSGRVVACGNSITDWTSELVSNLIGRCREKSLICIGFNFFQLLSVASPKTVVYVTMYWLPLKCMGLEYRVARNDVMGFHRYIKKQIKYSKYKIQLYAKSQLYVKLYMIVQQSVQTLSISSTVSKT